MADGPRGTRGIERLCQLGEFLRLGNHHAVHGQVLVGQQRFHDAPADSAQGGLGWLVPLEIVEHDGYRLTAIAMHMSRKQLRLPGEVIIERALRDTGFRGDARHARALVAVAGEDGRGPIEHLALFVW
jgi:hypothetical protein